MSNRYFALNTMAGGSRTSTTVQEITTAGDFDSAYVSSCITASNTNPLIVKAPFMGGATAITGTLWLRFDVKHVTYSSGSQGLVLIMTGANNAYRLFCNASGGLTMQYWNTVSLAWVNWGSTFTAPQGLQTVCLKIVLNSSFDVSYAGTSLASSAVVPTNGVSSVDQFQFCSCNSTNDAQFSQLMCADYDLTNSHLFSKLPSANGTYTDGTGTAADVNETPLDDGTAIGLPVVGNKHTFVKPTIGSVPSGLTIAGLAVNARARVAGGVVADGKIKIRSGTTDQTSSSKGFTSIYGPRSDFFSTDPATGLNWGTTTFDAAEFGLEAA